MEWAVKGVPNTLFAVYMCASMKCVQRGVAHFTTSYLCVYKVLSGAQALFSLLSSVGTILIDRYMFSTFKVGNVSKLNFYLGNPHRTNPERYRYSESRPYVPLRIIRPSLQL